MNDKNLKNKRNNLLAISNVFARAEKNLTMAEHKTIVYALTHFRFKEENPNCLLLDKAELARTIGIRCSNKHLNQNLKRSIGKLPEHSFIRFNNADLAYYKNGVLITALDISTDYVCITFNSDYMSLFSNLKKNFTLLWDEDIFSLTTERSILFYELIMLKSDTRNKNDYVELSTKQIKVFMLT